jgi:hypothetical protein
MIAEASGVPIGAAWLRLMPVHDSGYGFVAPDVPELSIAVVVVGRVGVEPTTWRIPGPLFDQGLRSPLAMCFAWSTGRAELYGVLSW